MMPMYFNLAVILITTQPGSKELARDIIPGDCAGTLPVRPRKIVAVSQIQGRAIDQLRANSVSNLDALSSRACSLRFSRSGRMSLALFVADFLTSSRTCLKWKANDRLRMRD